MLQTLFSDQIFSQYTIPLDDWIADGVDWLGNYRSFFLALKQPIQIILDLINSFLQWIPPIFFLALIFIIAWRVAGWRLGAFQRRRPRLRGLFRALGSDHDDAGDGA